MWAGDALITTIYDAQMGKEPYPAPIMSYPADTHVRI